MSIYIYKVIPNLFLRDTLRSDTKVTLFFISVMLMYNANLTYF